MTDIELPSSSSSMTPTNNDGLQSQSQSQSLINSDTVALYSTSRQIQQVVRETEKGDDDHLSVLAVLLTVFRKSLVGCSSNNNNSGVEEKLMKIGCPTDVRHVAHVTFDRFYGFLGLPVEFEPQVPRRPPSASTRVFGVSTESMQLSFDSRGNCIPTILLMMQKSLYLQGGLQSEGVFRINPENSREEYVREQLNNGVIPETIDVHCLAGLIKAWFRELPRGILDSLDPEQVMVAQSEDECSQLVKLLPPTEAALLDWAINLMADVAQLEHFNKMNPRNIAMVFAPNMTQMSDPLTALMYAVQVMNFLKTLVIKTLREREDCLVEAGPMLQLEPSDEDGNCSILKPTNNLEADGEDIAKEPLSNQISSSSTSQAESRTGNETHGFLAPIENIISDKKEDDTPADIHGGVQRFSQTGRTLTVECGSRRTKTRRLSNPDDSKKGSRRHTRRPVDHADDETAEKKKELNISSCLNSHAERVETWR